MGRLYLSFCIFDCLCKSSKFTFLPSSNISIKLPFCRVIKRSISRAFNIMPFISLIVGTDLSRGKLSAYTLATAAIKDCFCIFLYTYPYQTRFIFLNICILTTDLTFTIIYIQKTLYCNG